MDIFNFRFDTESEKPPPKHRQLAAEIKKLIKQGKIRGGEYLPGERTLAKELGVTRDVVHRAYKLLEEEKLFEYKSHMGHCLIKNPDIS